MENAGVSFDIYVDMATKRFPNEPLCPFPDGGECYIQEKARNCRECVYAKSSYEKFLNIVIEQSRNLKFDERGKLRGAKVFCVKCGAGPRTPLRKWMNSYICENCWRNMQLITDTQIVIENDRKLKAQKQQSL